MRKIANLPTGSRNIPRGTKTATAAKQWPLSPSQQCFQELPGTMAVLQDRVGGYMDEYNWQLCLSLPYST